MRRLEIRFAVFLLYLQRKPGKPSIDLAGVGALRDGNRMLEVRQTEIFARWLAGFA
jgi:hypothetical protein